MPRGKNYFNQNRGMTLQAASGDAVREACFFGRQCKRPDCIYRHPEGKETGSQKQRARADAARAPCKAFLAGQCPYDASVCHKRHPPENEISGWLQKYSKIPCRNGTRKACPTKGCLYYHPPERNTCAPTMNNVGDSLDLGRGKAFPPLNASFPPLSSNVDESLPSLKDKSVATKPTATISPDVNYPLSIQSEDSEGKKKSSEQKAKDRALPATSAWQQAPVGNISVTSSIYAAPWSSPGRISLPKDERNDSSRSTDLNVSAKEFVPSFLK